MTIILIIGGSVFLGIACDILIKSSISILLSNKKGV